MFTHTETSRAGTSNAGRNLRTNLHHVDHTYDVRLPLGVLEVLDFVLDGVHADREERRKATGARQRFTVMPKVDRKQQTQLVIVQISLALS